MFGGTTILAGPARAGKTRRLLERYRLVLAEGPLGSALWLGPTHRAAANVREQLLEGDLAGCFSPQCLTFNQFATHLLATSPLEARPIGQPLARQILARLVRQAAGRGELRYFGPIAHTRGFLDLLVGFIQELKRLEIWPEELAAATSRRTEKDAELCSLYERYQQVLTRHELYDGQGRFWSARAWLREGSRPPFDRLRHVFVDGFTDFTRTEHEVLEILARRVESLTLSVPLEDGGQREELFAKSLKTIEELKRRHPAARFESLAPRPLSCAAMTHVERNLFGNPRQVERSRDMRGIEILPAAGATDEIELVARRVKRLLVEGDATSQGRPVRPGEILVVFRSLDDAASLVEEVFGQFGIPASIGDQRVLASAPVMSALRAWLELDLEDWPFRKVLRLLGHNFFCPPWPEIRQGRTAALAVVHRLQIPSGRAQLLASVKRQAERATRARAPAESDRATLAQQATLALPLLTRMASVLDALPERGSLGQWSAAITRLAESTGMLEAPSSSVATVDALGDRSAWQQLITALSESENLSTWLGEQPGFLARREFVELLDDLLDCEPLSVDRDESGRVRVLSTDSVRNLSAPYVFVAGLSEQSFPPAHREDCIYSEAETRELISAGLPLTPHAHRRGQEMLLFYEVVTRATRHLVLSYPALDQAALPLSPSPYVREIEQLFAPECLGGPAAPPLTSVPETDEVFCPRDFRVRAVDRALAGDGALLGEWSRHRTMGATARNVAAGLQAISSRGRSEGFGPFEGMLTSPAARRALAERYGPERCWSPSQLEQYARCPYQFFLERVLRLEALDEPALDADYMGRGKMVHWVLSEVHRRLNVRAGTPCSPGDESLEQFSAATTALLHELVDRMLSERALANGLLEIDARHVAAWLADYHRQHSAYDARWDNLSTPLRPAYFEVSFGPTGHDDQDQTLDGEDPLSTPEPFELDCGSETIRFSGRIDRIDLGAAGERAVFSIVDYKSGKPSPRTSAQAVYDGYSLQLPLYALAAERLLAARKAVPFRAAYWHVAAGGYQEEASIKFHLDGDGQLAIDPQWESLESRLRHRVISLISGIRQGQFPMHSMDEKCTSHCPYHTVCRVNQVRQLEKTWQPPSEPLR
jgi:ATP-dependent helicase/nuclease subunit B